MKEHHCTRYVPDIMAGGSDCARCGHPQEVHTTLFPEWQNDLQFAAVPIMGELEEEYEYADDDEASS